MTTNDEKLLIEISTKQDILIKQNSIDHNAITTHLAKLNDKVVANVLGVAQNKDRIATQWKIGSGVLSVIGVIIVGIVLRLLFG